MRNDVHDPDRLEALKSLRALDTPVSEDPFLQIVETTARLFATANAAIHLLDGENQWVKAFVGEKFACRIEESFCRHAFERAAEVWVIPDAGSHPLFRDHALVTGGRIGFYAAATLDTSDGYRVGTLCVTDPKSRTGFSESQRELLQQLARIVIQTLELRKDFHEVRSALTNVAEFDGVTGLPNLSFFLKWALQMHRRADEDARFGLVRARITDTTAIKQYAGETGLNVLRHELARRLHENLGEMEMLINTSDGDFLFVRYFQSACDESVEQRTRDWISGRCEQVDRALSEPVFVKGNNFHVAACFGLAVFATAVAEPAAAMDATEIAAEKVESPGASHGVWYSEDLPASALLLASFDVALRKAVKDHEFKLAYQPVMQLDGAEPKVCGLEALLRWPGQSEPVWGPDVFIPMAEQKGLVGEIGLWVFKEACMALGRWRERWPIWISVNVSPLQLNDKTLPETFAAIASDAGVPPGQIKLEITESALGGQVEYVQDMLFRLREIGFQLALDDFGTGYSSLARVIQMPFSFIKVDRAFVSDAPSGPGAAVVAALREMTEELGMQAIAEGVETMEQEIYLLGKGYRFVQGYRYARPMFAEELENWLSSQFVEYLR